MSRGGWQHPDPSVISDAEMATWLDAATGRGRVGGMPVRADLDYLDSIIRRAASGPPVKHHEVSQALAALERIERELARLPERK